MQVTMLWSWTFLALVGYLYTQMHQGPVSSRLPFMHVSHQIKEEKKTDWIGVSGPQKYIHLKRHEN